MIALGLDLSLTSTGVAAVQDGQYMAWFNAKTKGKKGDGPGDYLTRIQDITQRTFVFIDSLPEIPVIAVVEGPSHGSKFGNPHERAGLWWDIFAGLVLREIPVATVAPKSRQKYITGSGGNGVGKDVVLAHAIERYVNDRTPVIPNDDVADGLGMADMGARRYGFPVWPDAHMPTANLQPMEAVKWPTS